jgi:hypothetical protein
MSIGGKGGKSEGKEERGVNGNTSADIGRAQTQCRLSSKLDMFRRAGRFEKRDTNGSTAEPPLHVGKKASRSLTTEEKLIDSEVGNQKNHAIISLCRLPTAGLQKFPKIAIVGQ